MSAAVVCRRAGDGRRVSRKHGEGMEYRAVVLTTVETMADPHSKRLTSNFEADRSA